MSEEKRPIEEQVPEPEATPSVLEMQDADDNAEVEAHHCISVLSTSKEN